MRILFAILLAPMTSACVVGDVVGAAVDVATIPVDIASAGVDAVTTSQSEADERRGREARKAEERYGKDLREWEEQCMDARQAGDSCPAKPEYQPPEPD